MFQRILVPLDGSERAERAIPVAASLARAMGGTLVFLRVVLPPVEFGTYGVDHLVAVKPNAYEARLAEAESYLDKVQIAYAEDLAGLAIEKEVDSGAVSSSICVAARLEHVDLVVLCSQGETSLKRWFFGSVAQEAIRQSPAPVLVLEEAGVGFPAPGVARPLRVLVPLDGSPLAEAVLEPAVHLATALAGPAPVLLHLLRIAELPSGYGSLKSQAYLFESVQEEARQEALAYLRIVADRLRAEVFPGWKLTITSSVLTHRGVAGAIVQAAERPTREEELGGFHLIAMATHGRSGLSRLLMGSVTEHVLGATRLPLFIVRPQEREAAREKGGESGHLTGIAVSV